MMRIFEYLKNAMVVVEYRAGINQNYEITKFKFIFPFATHIRYGAVEMTTVFGFRVWEKVGDKKALFGVIYN